MEPAVSLDLRMARHAGIPVLGPLYLSAMPGETMAVTGASGVGKTTLLRILAGLHADWDGTRHLPGRLAMVFQEPTLLPWRSALDNICIAAACAPDRGQVALAAVGLPDKAAAFPDALSLGQQRRVALARAFAADPDVLLLDEAFASLDAETAETMMALYEALRAGRRMATVLVTHDRAEAGRLAGRTLVLAGRPARLLPEPV